MPERFPHGIVILGPSGSGALEVGASLAAVICGKHIDVEAEFEKQAGSSLSHAYVTNPEGVEADLSKLSLECLALLTDGVVLSLPPSSPEVPEIRSSLEAVHAEGTPIVALDAPIDVLARRSGLTAPLMGYLGTPRAWFNTLHKQLVASYLPLADLWCNTGHASSSEVADQIVQNLWLELH